MLTYTLYLTYWSWLFSLNSSCLVYYSSKQDLNWDHAATFLRVPGSNFQTHGTMKLNLKECSLKDSKFRFGICSNFLFENWKNEKVSAERFICALINLLVLLLGAQQTSEVHTNNVCSTGYHWPCSTNVVLWKKTCSTVCDRPWSWGYCVDAGILLSLASML